MIEVYGLKKSYGEVKALDGINLKIERGKIFGLLGPNGAGKTTTFSIIATLLRPDEGDVLYNGGSIFSNVKNWREKIGFVPQEFSIYEDLTGYENVYLMGRLYNLPPQDIRKKVEELFEKLGLSEKMKEKVSRYSGGMKRRLNLMMSLVHDPEILLLDEPTAGIDVQTKQRIYDFLRELMDKGKTVLYTTHMLKEAEELFDVVGIIDSGKIVALGGVEDLINKYADELHVEVELYREKVEDGYELEKFGVYEKESGILKVYLKSQSEITDLLKKLTEMNFEVRHINLRKPSLETVFLKLTGRELRD